MESDDIRNKLIGLYFSMKYWGGSSLKEEDKDWLNNTFKLTPQLEGGYDYDRKEIEEDLDLNIEYTLKEMNVSQSSSYLTLKEFPNKNFNTVNFTYRVEENK